MVSLPLPLSSLQFNSSSVPPLLTASLAFHAPVPLWLLRVDPRVFSVIFIEFLVKFEFGEDDDPDRGMMVLPQYISCSVRFFVFFRRLKLEV